MDIDETVQDLFERCCRDHEAAINGNGNVYAMPSDATMLPSCGGVGRGGPVLADLQAQGAGLWEWGIGDVELIDGGVSGDVAWLVMVEDAQVKFIDLDAPTRWRVRVTELFRHTQSGWERFHRHADPLVWGHTLDQVRALVD
jgi:hypothetical protein